VSGARRGARAACVATVVGASVRASMASIMFGMMSSSDSSGADSAAYEFGEVMAAVRRPASARCDMRATVAMRRLSSTERSEVLGDVLNAMLGMLGALCGVSGVVRKSRCDAAAAMSRPCGARCPARAGPSSLTASSSSDMPC
jgi:hypothetical protein